MAIAGPGFAAPAVPRKPNWVKLAKECRRKATDAEQFNCFSQRWNEPEAAGGYNSGCRVNVKWHPAPRESECKSLPVEFGFQCMRAVKTQADLVTDGVLVNDRLCISPEAMNCARMPTPGITKYCYSRQKAKADADYVIRTRPLALGLDAALTSRRDARVGLMLSFPRNESFTFFGGAGSKAGSMHRLHNAIGAGPVYSQKLQAAGFNAFLRFEDVFLTRFRMDAYFQKIEETKLSGVSFGIDLILMVELHATIDGKGTPGAAVGISLPIWDILTIDSIRH